MQLNNKVAVVTGARRGIGKAIAMAFAEQGANVLVADLNKEDCEQVCQEIEPLAGEAIAVKCDVTNKTDTQHLMQKAMEHFGSLDILVNNAGIVIQKPFAEYTEEDWDTTLNVNLKGVFLCSKAAVPHMEEGKIISIASIAGKVGFPNTSAYGASKGGIITLTKELAIELAPNITVNAIAPGVIRTPMTSDMLEDKEQRQQLIGATPLERVGKPEEIGHAAVFLAQNDFITGHTLVVDGGWLAQ